MKRTTTPRRRTRRSRKSTVPIIPAGCQWLTPEQAGIYANLSPESLKELARRGLLPACAHKLNHLAGRRGSWRFSRSGLDQFIAGGGLTTDQRDRLRGTKAAASAA